MLSLFEMEFESFYLFNHRSCRTAYTLILYNPVYQGTFLAGFHLIQFRSMPLLELEYTCIDLSCNPAQSIQIYSLTCSKLSAQRQGMLSESSLDNKLVRRLARLLASMLE
mmetsp:Transcript_25337/g.50756  ORF Transcript_25337/g.50756 Transcript_25337/m.50756 type:complete len:110 (-) Transcript_25337:1312-1641(-)